MNRYWENENRNQQHYNRDYDEYNRSRYSNRNQGNYNFDDYGDAAHGGYGNEGYRGSYGNQGDESANYRNYNRRNDRNLGPGYAASPNYGSMGSYGGAQGFGSSRAGYAGQKHYRDNSGSQYYSGHGESGSAYESGNHAAPRHQVYGAYRDRNSFESSDRNYGPSQKYGSYDPYGSGGYGSSRGMQDYDQSQRGYYNMGSPGIRSRNYQQYDNRPQYQHTNYRQDYYRGGNTNRGDYMGSGYSRESHGEYGPMVNYGRNYESYYQNQPRSRSQNRNRYEGPVRSHSRID